MHSPLVVRLLNRENFTPYNLYMALNKPAANGLLGKRATHDKGLGDLFIKKTRHPLIDAALDINDRAQTANYKNTAEARKALMDLALALRGLATTTPVKPKVSKDEKLAARIFGLILNSPACEKTADITLAYAHLQALYGVGGPLAEKREHKDGPLIFTLVQTKSSAYNSELQQMAKDNQLNLLAGGAQQPVPSSANDKDEKPANPDAPAGLDHPVSLAVQRSETASLSTAPGDEKEKEPSSTSVAEIKDSTNSATPTAVLSDMTPTVNDAGTGTQNTLPPVTLAPEVPPTATQNENLAALDTTPPVVSAATGQNDAVTSPKENAIDLTQAPQPAESQPSIEQPSVDTKANQEEELDLDSPYFFDEPDDQQKPASPNAAAVNDNMPPVEQVIPLPGPTDLPVQSTSAQPDSDNQPPAPAAIQPSAPTRPQAEIDAEAFLDDMAAVAQGYAGPQAFGAIKQEQVQHFSQDTTKPKADAVRTHKTLHDLSHDALIYISKRMQQVQNGEIKDERFDAIRGEAGELRRHWKDGKGETKTWDNSYEAIRKHLLSRAIEIAKANQAKRRVEGENKAEPTSMKLTLTQAHMKELDEALSFKTGRKYFLLGRTGDSHAPTFLRQNFEAEAVAEPLLSPNAMP